MQADLQGHQFKPTKDTLQQPSNETAAGLWPSESGEPNKVVPLPAAINRDHQIEPFQ